MSNREKCNLLLDSFTEGQLAEFAVLLQLQLDQLTSGKPDEEPNEITYAAIEASQKDEDIYGPFDSVDALMEALNA